MSSTEKKPFRILVVGTEHLSRTTWNMIRSSIEATGAIVERHPTTPDAIAHVAEGTHNILNIVPNDTTPPFPGLSETAFASIAQSMIEDQASLTSNEPSPFPVETPEDSDAFEPPELEGGEPNATFFTVALYETNLSFGGSEEGGWWYDTGSPMSDPTQVEIPLEFVFPRYFPVVPGPSAVEKARKQAYDYAKALNEFLDGRLKRPAKSSTVSRDHVEARVSDGMPHAYPSRRPRYE